MYRVPRHLPRKQPDGKNVSWAGLDDALVSLRILRGFNPNIEGNPWP